jgi:tetratricopeptide (TPR) repeat protein
MPDWRWLARIAWLIPAIVVCLLYLPTLGNQFVWDDNDLLYNQPFLRDPSLWTEALRHFLTIISPNYFRPLAVTTFLIEARLWGLNPGYFHLTNLLLHAINTALVALLALELTRRRFNPARQTIIAVVVGLLYGLHPALVEGVSFISSRFDLLMTTCLLLALLADTKLRDRKFLRPILVGVLFLAAVLSKESAALFPPALLLFQIALVDQKFSIQNLLARLKSSWVTWVALAVGSGIYLAMRWLALGYLYRLGAPSAIPAGDLLQRLLLVALSLAEYFVLTVFPFTTLSPLHVTTLPIPLVDSTAWLALIEIVVLIVTLVLIARRSLATSALIFAGIVALLPAINLLPLELSGGTFAAERYLTYPLAFFALGSGVALARTFENIRARKTIALLVTLWLVACAGTIELTLPHWRDSFTLWTWASERAPTSALPHVNLSNYYIDQNDNAHILSETDAALQRDSNNAMAWNNRGVALFNTNQFAAAQAAWEKASQIEPTNALFWSNLANALRAQNRWQDAERILIDQALHLDPNFALAHFSLGALYLNIDRPDLAIAPLERAIQLLPPTRQQSARDSLAQTRDPQRWLRLGNLLSANNDAQGAQKAYAQAVTLGATPADVAVSQSAVLISSQAWADAENILRAALTSAPNDARLYNNLGVIAQARGDTNTARDYYTRAATLAPNWDLPKQNLKMLETK